MTVDERAARVNEGFDASTRAQALARYYDLDFADVAYDAELYQELAQQGTGPVLELAVGSGRLAIPLALAGHEVVGIDNDPAMLDRARTTWQDVRGALAQDRLSLHEGDLFSYREKPRFGLAFIAVNTFLLSEDDSRRIELLKTMATNLQNGGIAAVEVSTPSDEVLAGYDGRLQHEWLRTDPETGEQVTKTISARHDPEAQTVVLTQIYESTPANGGRLSRVVTTDTLHPVTAEHLAELASAAGFGSVELKGDYLPMPYGAGSHRAILLARLV
jgi:predicted O-methyltransferase YrrM